MDASAGLVPWQPHRPFHAMCQCGEAPRRVKHHYRALPFSRGQSWLREASNKVSETETA